jgi:hypothetical protein
MSKVFFLATFSFITRLLSDVQALNNREQVNNNARAHTHFSVTFRYCNYASRGTGKSSGPTFYSANAMWVNMQYSWNAEWRGKNYKWIFLAKYIFPRPIPVPQTLHDVFCERIQISAMRSPVNTNSISTGYILRQCSSSSDIYLRNI